MAGDFNLNPSSDFAPSRECFRHPIPELHYAADLLSRAADAFIAGHYDIARNCIRQADMPAVHAYAAEIMGRTQARIHRCRQVDASSAADDPASTAPRRMPGAGVQFNLFERDGWRCRFCGCRVLFAKSRDILRQAFPDALAWGPTNAEMHAAFFALTAVADHIVPYARGGSHEPTNLVTTCQPCNYGRGSWLLEEVGLIDPRTRPPILDGWDGLTRVLAYAKQARLVATSTPVTDAAQAATAHPVKTEPDTAQLGATEPDTAQLGATEPGTSIAVAPGQPAAPKPPTARRPRKLSPEQWFAELDRLQPGVSERLLSFLRGCERIQVWWRLDKVMVLNLRTRDTTLNVIGILPNGEVYIPWFIDREKDKFRRFAERLVQAIPDTIVYESPKQWIVRKAGRTPVNILEFLEASSSVHAALEELCKAVNASVLAAKPAYNAPTQYYPSLKSAPPEPTPPRQAL
jgi:5-methylcytosine-specific restriction endonuclease McrA